jgi:hypothetical protein
MVQKAYENAALNRSNAFRWYSRFRGGRELVEYYERGGSPKSTRTDVNIAAVADLVKNDRRIASRIIAESLNIPKSVVRPAAFCSRDFFLLHNNVPAHKAANVCQFLTPQKYYNPLSPPVLSRFISARLFSVPKAENEVKMTPLSGCC